ncbi:GntR family transcriptional regulator, partial [Planobispora rosea]
MSTEESRWLTGGQVYDQIAARLRARITAGTYPPGTALPSEAALVAEFRVA